MFGTQLVGFGTALIPHVGENIAHVALARTYTLQITFDFMNKKEAKGCCYA